MHTEVDPQEERGRRRTTVLRHDTIRHLAAQQAFSTCNSQELALTISIVTGTTPKNRIASVGSQRRPLTANTRKAEKAEHR